MSSVVESVFPFLIGRIRTYYIYTLQNIRTKFPFLIGRIRTEKHGFIDPIIIDRFPFLIGRIRTQPFHNFYSKPYSVSIPHR